MIYDSLDIIPLKLYIRIAKTGDVSLLTNEKSRLKASELKTIWLALQKAYNELEINPGAKKVLDVSVRVETMKAKYNFIISATNCLNFERDEELEKELRALGYTLNATPEDYFKNLKSIKTRASGILVKIARLEKQLPKKKEGEKISTIDRVIMGYCSVTGLTYDTNKITVTQFAGLKSLFEDKIKAIEKNKPKKPKSARTNNAK